jgi:hypothetical protein
MRRPGAPNAALFTLCVPVLLVHLHFTFGGEPMCVNNMTMADTRQSPLCP